MDELSADNVLVEEKEKEKETVTTTSSSSSEEYKVVNFSAENVCASCQTMSLQRRRGRRRTISWCHLPPPRGTRRTTSQRKTAEKKEEVGNVLASFSTVKRYKEDDLCAYNVSVKKEEEAADGVLASLSFNKTYKANDLAVDDASAKEQEEEAASSFFKISQGI